MRTILFLFLLPFVSFCCMHLYFMLTSVSYQMFFHWCSFMYPHWGFWNKPLDDFQLRPQSIRSCIIFPSLNHNSPNNGDGGRGWGGGSNDCWWEEQAVKNEQNAVLNKIVTQPVPPGMRNLRRSLRPSEPDTLKKTLTIQLYQVSGVIAQWMLCGYIDHTFTPNTDETTN